MKYLILVLLSLLLAGCAAQYADPDEVVAAARGVEMCRSLPGVQAEVQLIGYNLTVHCFWKDGWPKVPQPLDRFDPYHAPHEKDAK